MESKEKLESDESKRAEMRAQIDHFLNDYGEYPDIWLTDEEKVDVENKAATDSTLKEKQNKWRHNKYSVTWWLTPVLLVAERMAKIYMSSDKDNEKQTEFYKKIDELIAQVSGENQKGKISKKTVDRVTALLEEIRASL